MNNSTTTSQRDGSIIVTALLIVVAMATILSVVLTVILNSVRSSRNYSSGLISQYAADAGVERGLFYTQIGRASQQVSAWQVEAYLNGGSGDDAISFQQLGNSDVLFISNAKVDRDSRIEFTNVKQNETVQADFFVESQDGEYSLQPLSEDQSWSLEVTWSESQNCTPAASRVNIGLVRWSPQQWQDFNDQNTVQSEYPIQCSLGGVVDEGRLVTCEYRLELDANYLYKVRATPLTCDLQELQFDAYYEKNEEGTNNLSGFIDYYAFGIDGSRTIAGVEARSVWRASLLGYFNYVVFSESELVKE